MSGKDNAKRSQKTSTGKQFIGPSPFDNADILQRSRMPPPFAPKIPKDRCEAPGKSASPDLGKRGNPHSGKGIGAAIGKTYANPPAQMGPPPIPKALGPAVSSAVPKAIGPTAAKKGSNWTKEGNRTTYRNAKELDQPGMTEESSGPYAELSYTPRSVQAGAGLVNAQWENGAHIKAFQGSAQAGMGDGVYGAEGEVSMTSMQSPTDLPIGVGMDYGTAKAGLIATDEKAGFGASADLISGHAHLGGISDESTTDSQVKVGTGIGVGSSAHLHYGDSDGDGYREYGFEVSGKFGPGFTLGYKSEDPLRDFIPGGQFIPEDFNVTHEAWNAGEKAWDAIGAGWDRFSNWVGW